MPMTSLPFTHQMEAELEPTDRRTLGISRGQLTVVTAQYTALKVGFPRPKAKWYRLTLKSIASTACHVSSVPPTVTLSPSRGTTENWLGKYSFLIVAWTKLSVSSALLRIRTTIGSSSSHRRRKPLVSG